MHWLGPPLRGRARVEQKLIVLARFVYRCVAVTEDDHIGLGKASSKPAGPTGRGAAVVNHADPHAVELDYSGQGEDPDQRLIVVAEHGMNRGKLAELIEHTLIQNIPGVQNGVCTLQMLPGGRRQRPPRAASTCWRAAEVGVGQDCNPKDPAGLRPLPHDAETTRTGEEIGVSCAGSGHNAPREGWAPTS